MRLADHLVADQDKHEVEIGVGSPDVLQNGVNHGEFLQKRDLLFIVVEEAARCVSQLENEDVLGETSLNVRPQKLLKEAFEFAKTANTRKLVLEKAPNIV